MNNVDLAKWFMNKDVHLRDGTNDANTKLNKMVYFSNLMYYSKFEEKLNNDIMERWDNGPVSRDIYKDYRYYNLSSSELTAPLPDKVKKVVEIVFFVFGQRSARSLSDECHTHNIWLNGKRNDVLEISNIDANVKEYMKNLYEIYETIDFDTIGIEKVNGNSFYYDKTTVDNNDEFIAFLSSFDIGLDEVPFIFKEDGEYIVS